MSIDTSAFKTIISHLRRSFDDIHVDRLIKAGETKFDEMENFENYGRTPALLIYLYTNKPTKPIYKELNLILRNHFQNCIKGKYISEDLNFAPYAAALTAILLHWPKLKAIHTLTYWGMDKPICEKDRRALIWFGFSSSSTIKEVAKKYHTDTFYTITNSSAKKWLPKSISIFSESPCEDECMCIPIFISFEE